MFRSFLFLVAVSFVGHFIVTPGAAYSADNDEHFCTPSLTRTIPSRTRDAMSASSFVKRVSKTSGKQREALILDQVMDGNIPDFLRNLYPVTIKKKMHDGSRVTITLCVMPDYLAVGSNRDYLRIPMGMKTATTIAHWFDFTLPTPKIVDAIHAQTDKHLSPKPMEPGPEMTSAEYYLQHNRLVEQQRRAKNIPLGSLLAGQKKDLVITKNLRKKSGRVAIYGWQHPNGKPIQPLSTVHDAEYADYSHGVRLVSTTAFVNGKKRSLYDLLEDPKLASMISKEGRIPNAEKLVAPKLNITAKRLLAYKRSVYKNYVWVN